MIIHGEVTKGLDSELVTSEWIYNSEDPWAVEVEFLEAEVAWVFSLDLLKVAFELPFTGFQGVGDVKISVISDLVFVRLDNGKETVTLKFPAEDIQEFLSQVDDSGSEEIIARELDEFLEAL